MREVTPGTNWGASPRGPGPAEPSEPTARRTYTIRLRDGRVYPFWARSFSEALALLRPSLADGYYELHSSYRSLSNHSPIESVSVDPPLPEVEVPE